MLLNYSWDIILFAQIVSIAHSIGNWQLSLGREKQSEINV